MPHDVCRPTVAMSVAEPQRAALEGDAVSLETLLTSDVAAMRESWQFAAIIQFCRMFAPSLKLRGFSAELLESAMLDPDAHRVFLSELLYKLLRPDASQGFSEGDAAAWEHLLRKKLASHWREAFEEHPLAQRDFFEIASMTRVRRCGAKLDSMRWVRLAGLLLNPVADWEPRCRCACSTLCASGVPRSAQWSVTTSDEWYVPALPLPAATSAHASASAANIVRTRRLRARTSRRAWCATFLWEKTPEAGDTSSSLVTTRTAGYIARSRRGNGPAGRMMMLQGWMLSGRRRAALWRRLQTSWKS